MLSLCMIVKNEEGFLVECLQSFKGIVDEIIIVDTGSSDNTAEVALTNGASIFNFKWIDDFSEARNFAISLAKGDWIFMPDADDVLDSSAHDAVRQCIEDKSAWGYRIPVVHYSNDSKAPNWHAMKQPIKGFSGFLLTKAIKLFQNRKEIHYRFAVHESVRYSIEEHKGAINDAPFVLHHYGSLRGKESRAGKHDYYLSLSLKDCARYPDHPKPFYEAGVAYFEKRMLKEAKDALERAAKNDERCFMPYHYLGEIALGENNLQQARALFEKSIKMHPEHAETHYALGVTAAKSGDTNSAKKILTKALQMNNRSIRYFDTLVQLHLAQQELLPALALLYDACANTNNSLFLEKRQQLEHHITGEAKRLLSYGPNETAYLWLAMVAVYQQDKVKSTELCRKAKKYFPNAPAFDAVTRMT